jgi:transposase-like protein
MTSERPTLLNAPQRLRAIAEAIEQGNSLTRVAARFRVPIRVLQRVVTPKRSLRRPSKVISPKTLAAAVELIRQRHSFKATAILLKVNLSTLSSALLKHGFTAKKLRPPDVARDEKLAQAVSAYQQGAGVADICRTTGIPERTLYAHLHRQGVPFRQPRTAAAVRS